MPDEPFLADFGQGFAAPPWILGHRGSPLEAPENTLSSMRQALELGLDGFEYDLRACASGASSSTVNAKGENAVLIRGGSNIAACVLTYQVES